MIKRRGPPSQGWRTFLRYISFSFRGQIGIAYDIHRMSKRSRRMQEPVEVDLILSAPEIPLRKSAQLEHQFAWPCRVMRPALGGTLCIPQL